MSKHAKRRYKKKMSEYYNAEYNLKVYLNDLDKYLRECDKEYMDFPRVYKNESDLYGNVMDNFQSKSSNYDSMINSILEEAARKRSLIYRNKERAHELYKHYKELYEREDED